MVLSQRYSPICKAKIGSYSCLQTIKTGVFNRYQANCFSFVHIDVEMMFHKVSLDQVG